MDVSKRKNTFVIIEAFLIWLIVHAIGGYYFAPKLAEVFPKTPPLVIGLLSSSAISPLAAMVYLALRTRFIPKFIIKKEMSFYIPAGIIGAWVVAYTNLFVSSNKIPFAQEIHGVAHPYFYFTLFLVLIWGPFLEETLNRGYFFELLRTNWGDALALLFSSTLFVLFHGIWGGFSINLLFIFLYSVIFTAVYMGGGLVASIAVHASINLYLLYVGS